MKGPLVSVVMSVYNDEKYIGEAIESILNQTYKNFEFIIIDDASKDKSLDIIKKYAKKDKRIIILKNKANLKICKSLNKGIKIAKGKYIARMDGDDISFSERFAEQVNFMESNPQVGVVGSWIEILNKNYKKIIKKYPKEDKKLRQNIFFYSPIAHPVAMIRKEVFSKIGGYNKEFPLSQDLELWFRIGTKYQLASIQKVLLKYRESNKKIPVKLLIKKEKYANKIRWKNRKNKAYKFGIKAFVYNGIHYLSLYLIPPQIKTKIFNIIRNKK
jgi:glycosyltransferase involved in cell wall biosynthesis